MRVLHLATREFVPPEGSNRPHVHLVAAIHIADRSFYEARQALLDEHDLVLYEGVRPRGARDLPPEADDGARDRLTRVRAGFLLGLAEDHRKATGRFPPDATELRAAAHPRWRDLLRWMLVDGWGRPLRYAATEGGTRGDAPPSTVTVSSDGPDGRPNPAGVAGDDIALTAAAGKAPPLPGGSALYAEVAEALGLVDQSVIDTARPRWRNSDLSMDEVEEEAAARGADMALLLGFIDGTNALGAMAKAAMAMVRKSPRMAFALKSQMAHGLAQVESGRVPSLPVKGGEAILSVVIGTRNDAVLRDLDALAAADPRPRTVAVFYGAGHMPDLERRLVEERGYRPGTTTWEAAIRVDPQQHGVSEEDARRMRAAFDRMGAPPAGAAGR